MKTKNRKIVIDDTQYWLVGDWQDGAIAPLHHCDAQGNITYEAAFEGAMSFAHCYDGRVMQFGNLIGHLSDDLTFTPAKAN